ncbi:hypothetical protein [Nonomuraea sp. CA-141351]|uniref:hypothetical protein n=1 Tax=Nonomuraea sp. CA-141351 TaxID=3239996 RepID=UPI003D8B36A8
MGEMRRLLAVLRVDADDDPDADNYAPAPGLQRLGALAERVRAAGVPVEVSITGSVRPLPSGIDVCAYRVVQESLTNVLKTRPRPRRASACTTEPNWNCASTTTEPEHPSPPEVTATA